jgi:cysteine synthase A
VDQVLPVSGADALRLARELAVREGIFTGISGGATLAGALELCRALPPGSNVLCMLPDTGERYLSTPLFADVSAEMDEEELALSRPASNDSGLPAARPSPRAAPVAESATGEADAFVAAVLRDRKQPVVLFALEWCEFCWSVRRMFARFGIPYRAIDLDSVQYQADNRGGAIRAALSARTGVATIPQVFIGGELVGGCTDLMEGWRSGRVQRMLTACGVAHRHDDDVDPRSFLPSWLPQPAATPRS